MTNEEKELLHIKAVYYTQADKDGHFENANKRVQVRQFEGVWKGQTNGEELKFTMPYDCYRLTPKTVNTNLIDSVFS